MNRWKRAAILCAIAAAVSNSSPVSAALNRNAHNAETAAISVASLFPANMATGVMNDTPLTVEFGGAVNQSFYETINVNLFSGTDTVDGELFYNPSARQVMFKPRQPLNPGQTYTAQLQFYDGLGRTAEKVWSFQTGGNVPTAALPVQTSSAPTAQTQTEEQALVLTNASMGAGSIRNDLPMEVSFSEPVDIVSLKSAPITLLQDNRPIGIDYKLSRDLKTVTISPRAGLTQGAAYAIAVDRNLVSTSGTRLRKKTLIPFKLSGSFEEPQVAQHVIDETPAPVSNGNNSYDNPFAQPSRQTQVQMATRPAQTQRNFAPAPAAQPVADPVQVVGLAPQNGSRITNLTQPVTIAFSEEIQPETLNEFTFRLEDDFGPVPAKIHYFQGHRQATLTPVGLLDSNKNYRVVVTQGITDTNGRPIRSGINSMFATASPVSQPAVPQMTAATQTAPSRETAELENFDNDFQPAARTQMARQTASPQSRNQPARQAVSRSQTAGTASAMAPADRTVRTAVNQAPQRQSNLKAFKVTSIFPGSDANNVQRRSKIAVHFSEPADPNTINNVNISVFANQTRVEGKVVYDRNQNRAIFEPTRPLDAKTDYKVIVSDKIKSRMGEPLTQRFAWQFATADTAARQYAPANKSVEADSSFYIPLVDSKLQRAPGHNAAAQKPAGTQSSFSFVDPKHWAFKAMRHVSNKGILNSFPFTYTDSVTRYEFASAINNALSNLKSMQHMPGKMPKLKVADMVQLQQLIIEFRSELKSYNVNTVWFETFLQQQGVNMRQVEAQVQKLNRS